MVSIPIEQGLRDDWPEGVDEKVKTLDALLLDVAAVRGDVDQFRQVFGDQLQHATAQLGTAIMFFSFKMLGVHKCKK